MAGALSSLGLGSNGVLSSDIIDQLKEADTTSIITPIENKIETSNTKQSVLSDIKSLITDLNDQVVALSEPELYQNKTSSLTGSSVSVETSSSAQVQNFDINVKNLATRDIQQSQGFGSSDALIGEVQTLTLTIDGESYDIDIGITDGLESVVEKINEQTDGKIEASVLNTGEGTEPYKLILKSTETGSDNAITAESTGSLSINRIEDRDPPVDAKIEIDGITIERASNTIDDLIEGVTLNLQEEGSTSVKVTSDHENLMEEMSAFAEKYNAVVEKLSAVTKYDEANKTVGVFQGTSEIRAITATLNNIIGETITSDGKTIADFGLEPERGGTLAFDKTTLEEMLTSDAGAVEDYFRGTDGDNGLFNKFEDAIFNISTSSSGALKSLNNNIEDTLSSLLEEQTKAQTRLDDKYAIMTKRFAAFDSVIASLSSQSTTIQSMIDAQFAEK